MAKPKELQEAKIYPDIIPLSYPQYGAGGNTGSWRFLRPVMGMEKCIHCLKCWIHCPEAVIDRDSLEINLDYCKGCGICATECPKGAIAMVVESQIAEDR